VCTVLLKVIFESGFNITSDSWLTWRLEISISKTHGRHLYTILHEANIVLIALDHRRFFQRLLMKWIDGQAFELWFAGLWALALPQSGLRLIHRVFNLFARTHQQISVLFEFAVGVFWEDLRQLVLNLSTLRVRCRVKSWVAPVAWFLTLFGVDHAV
jgi:hypothetical protein